MLNPPVSEKGSIPGAGTRARPDVVVTMALSALGVGGSVWCLQDHCLQLSDLLHAPVRPSG
jgi:hypothetical protein